MYSPCMLTQNSMIGTNTHRRLAEPPVRTLSIRTIVSSTSGSVNASGRIRMRSCMTTIIISPHTISQGVAARRRSPTAKINPAAPPRTALRTDRASTPPTACRAETITWNSQWTLTHRGSPSMLNGSKPSTRPWSSIQSPDARCQNRS